MPSAYCSTQDTTHEYLLNISIARVRVAASMPHSKVLTTGGICRRGDTTSSSIFPTRHLPHSFRAVLQHVGRSNVLHGVELHQFTPVTILVGLVRELVPRGIIYVPADDTVIRLSRHSQVLLAVLAGPVVLVVLRVDLQEHGLC